MGDTWFMFSDTFYKFLKLKTRMVARISQVKKSEEVARRTLGSWTIFKCRVGVALTTTTRDRDNDHHEQPGGSAQSIIRLARGIAHIIATVFSNPLSGGEERGRRSEEIQVTIKAFDIDRERSCYPRASPLYEKTDEFPGRLAEGMDEVKPPPPDPKILLEEKSGISPADQRIKQLEQAIAAASTRCSVLQQKIDATNAANVILRSSARAGGLL